MTFHFTALPPLSLYVHIPWCVRKCPYCDFNSHESKGDIPEQSYVRALLADLDQELERLQGRPVQSIFLGGGTPSLFSPQQVMVRSLVTVSPGAVLGAICALCQRLRAGGFTVKRRLWTC